MIGFDRIQKLKSMYYVKNLGQIFLKFISTNLTHSSVFCQSFWWRPDGRWPWRHRGEPPQNRPSQSPRTHDNCLFDPFLLFHHVWHKTWLLCIVYKTFFLLELYTFVLCCQDQFIFVATRLILRNISVNIIYSFNKCLKINIKIQT